MIHRIILNIFYLFLFLSFIFCDESICIESKSKIFLGFAENGFWHEKGAIYLKISPIKNINGLISSKYKNRFSQEIYIEMPYEEIKNYFSFQSDDQFQLYSKDGYLGDYKIGKVVILVNGCTGDYYFYIKLDGKINISEDNEISVIAKAINKNQKSNEFKIFTQVKLDKKEKSKIERILSDKLEYARRNIFTEILLDIENKRKEKLDFKLKYQVFSIKDSIEKENLIINAVWHCDDGALMSDTGYYLNGIFLINNKTIDLKPIELTEGGNLNISAIDFGIDIEMNNKIQWIIKYQFWEGEQTNLIEWENRQQKVIIEGNSFGC